MQQYLSSVPNRQPDPDSVFYLFGGLADDFWFWCLTEGCRAQPWLKQLLPGMPDEGIQKQFTGRSNDLALEQAFGFYRICKQELAKQNRSLQPESRLMDFGCGWGRITRFWLKDVYPQNLLGVDVYAPAIKICQESNFPNQFECIASDPPINLPDNSLDCIVAYSVFSHLSEKSARVWIKEFQRILKPGGMVLVTTRPREAVLEFAKLRNDAQHEKFALGSAASFGAVEEVLQNYDAGKYCFDAQGGDSNIPGEYGETLIPLAYAQEAYAAYFRDIRMLDFKEHGQFDQNLLILSSPVKGATPSAATGMDEANPIAEMPWTGERLVPSVAGQIAVEHLHRYAVAASLASGRIVLDLACGEGYGSNLLAATAQQVIGMDISVETIRHAESKYKLKNLKYIVGAAEAIPLPDQSVDMVVSFETIEHIQGAEKFLAEIKRCLKPQGVLIISSPDKSIYDAENSAPNPFHVRELDHAELLRLLGEKFSHVLAGRQKIVHGSYIAADEPDTRIVHGTFAGDYQKMEFQPGVKQGVYSVAICSDRELDRVPLGIFENERLYSAIDATEWANTIQQLESARLGLRFRANLAVLLQHYLQGRFQEQENALAESRQFYAVLEKNRDMLQQRLQTMQAEKQQLLGQIQEFSQQLATQQEQIRALNQHLAQVRVEQEALREQLTRAQAEQAGLQAELTHAHAEKAGLQAELTQTQSEKSVLRQELSQTRESKNTLEQELAQKHQQMAWLRELLLRFSEQLHKNRFAMTRLQHVWPAVKLTLTRKLNFARRIKGRKHAPAWWRQRWQSRPAVVRMVRQSGYFDREFYLAQLTPAEGRLQDPIRHYLRWGAAAGKNPNPYFDQEYYLEHNPEVGLAGVDPFLHFITQGEEGLRNPGPMFSAIDYMENYPDVVLAGISPFKHFWLYGRQEGRLPKALDKPTGSSAGHVLQPKANELSGQEAGMEKSDGKIDRIRRQSVCLPEKTDLDMEQPRLIAFYLPQYHPIPENNEWWGEGFTEWEYVTQARPLFSGHYQPHLPADLGFYDLRVPETREQQAALARAYGIQGFCYYYYWFNGQRLLERPLQEVLASGKPDFPFCICWANENWTRNWDGQEKDILLTQEHTLESDRAFIHEIIPLLKDPRYIRYQGKPVLLVYRVDRMSDPKQTARAWREECALAGIADLHLCAVETVGFGDPRTRGFDALVEFPPNHFATRNIAATLPGLNPHFSGHVADYREIMQYSLQQPAKPFTYHRGIMTRWDNTPRKRERSLIFHQATPGRYREWLEGLISQAQARPKTESLIFINAWNEWGEGAHLEPDLQYGHAWLEATQQAWAQAAHASSRQMAGSVALVAHPADDAAKEANEPAEKSIAPEKHSHQTARRQLGLIIHDCHCHGAQYIALALARTLCQKYKYSLDIVCKQDGELLAEFGKYGKVIRLTEEIRQHGSEPAALAAIGRQLQQDQISACICNTVVTGDFAAWLKQQGFKILGLVHELPTLIKTYGYQHLAKQIVEAADTVVFPSAYVQKAFLDWHPLPLAKCRVRPQGILQANRYIGKREAARQTIAQRHGLGPDSKIVLNCAYADLRKGPDLFVSLAKSVLLQIAPLNVHFIWAGSLQKEFQAWLQHDLACSGLEKNVHFIGFQKDDALYMAAADVFALTSREDPFPNVVLSAMEAEVPVVAFANSGGAPEVLADGCGIVVPYLDFAAMAQAIGSLLCDPDQARILGQAGRAKAKQDYQFDAYARKLLADLGLAG